MSFFEDASLVLIPSGYKASKVYSVKPTDGTGDLSFTRALDTATRVGPDGLIEKVRTNAILHSNGFSNVVWDSIGTTETSGQAGFDGTNNAWFLTEDSSTGNHLIRQFPSVYGLTTLSIYAKAGTRNFVYLRGVQSSANVIGWFNLSTGTVGTVQANGTGKIENVGGGWYRCSLTVANFQSAFELYVGLSNADSVTSYTGNGSGNILIQNFQYETGDIATPYIPTTTAAVSVGMLANVPRLDYEGGGCPKLLLEPQRTNLITFSEQINNAAWSKFRSSVTSNVAVSPAGFLDADKIIDNTENNSHGILQAVANTSGVQSSVSVFAKAAERSFLYISVVGGPSQGSFFDLSNGTIGSVLSFAPNARSIEDYGNGWYRCSITYTATDASSDIAYGPATANGVNVYIGDNTSGILIYGCQTEVGSYATSYIPTLGAAVTRSADAASKTGISALIGQTEGTLFVDMTKDFFESPERFIAVSDGTTSNRIMVNSAAGGGIRGFITSAGITQFDFTSVISSIGTHKIALAYANNDVTLYIDGVQVTTDNSATIPAVANLFIGMSEAGATASLNGSVNQALVFKTRLTNAQLAELTA